MHQIKYVPNFIDKEKIDFFIDYINFLEESIPEKFGYYQSGKRIALQFGEDLYNDVYTHLSLDLVKDKQQEIRDVFKKIVDRITTLYSEEDDLHVCSFWFAKQYPGAIIPEHDDTDDGSNSHFEYSVVLYLNTIKDGGILEFPQLKYSHNPTAGDLIIFPTKTTGEHLVSKIGEDRYSLVFWVTKDKKFTI
jgi:hypothetical protein